MTSEAAYVDGSELRQFLLQEFQFLRKGRGLAASKIERSCPRILGLALIDSVLENAGGDRVVAAFKFCKTQILTFRRDTRGEILRRAFAIGFDEAPRNLTTRREDVARDMHMSSETVRDYEDEDLLNLVFKIVDLETIERRNRAGPGPVIDLPPYPLEAMTHDVTYSFENGKKAVEWLDVRTVRCLVAGVDGMYVRHLYSGGNAGIVVHVVEGGEVDRSGEVRHRERAASEIFLRGGTDGRLCLQREVGRRLG